MDNEIKTYLKLPQKTNLKNDKHILMHRLISEKDDANNKDRNRLSEWLQYLNMVNL